MTYALGAGALNGSHEHSHFELRIMEPGQKQEDALRIDPWILFRQMYLDHQSALTTLQA